MLIRARLALAGTVLAALASPARATPDERPLAEGLEVSPGECLAARPAAAELRRWLGRDTLPAQLGIRLALRQGTLVSILLRDGEPLGVREFPPADGPCIQRLRAAAAALAAAIDALPQRRKTVAIPIVVAAPAAVTPPPAPAARWELGVAVLGTGTVTPRAALGARMTVRRTSAWGGMGLLGRVSSSFPAAVGPGQASLTLLGGGAEVCRGPRSWPAVAFCIAGLVAWLDVRGEGFQPSHKAVLFWPLVTAGIEVSLLRGERFRGLFILQGEAALRHSALEAVDDGGRSVAERPISPLSLVGGLAGTFSSPW